MSHRENNRVMRGNHSSKEGSKDFTGTKSYSEALNLMQTGYDEAAKMLKRDVKNKSKINAKCMGIVKHPTPHSAVVGYIPNVPNAIRNLPASMISIDRTPMKRKTLDIIYSQHGSCARDQEYFSKAGAALLSAVEVIEKSGIQTQIDLAFMTAEGNSQLAFPTVRIKRYDERYSFQKVSFPLVHPSMFRRIGFKWLETSPAVTDNRFNIGYGHPPTDSTLRTEISLPKNTYLLTTAMIHGADCSTEAILEKLEVI
ncbi:MAG: hypothetical protein J6T99_07150 [Oscillospiraceae bacterium]|nr:hypothetical protein [Oscillospiraceae bacterium]